MQPPPHRADLILNFGDVSGAVLTIHTAGGKAVQVEGAKAVLADFLDEHEVSAMQGTGLRVALIFWQQRTVVLSDHVVNSLGAERFGERVEIGGAQRSAVSSAVPDSATAGLAAAGSSSTAGSSSLAAGSSSTSGDLVMVLGHQGAGKTTVVRKLIDSLPSGSRWKPIYGGMDEASRVQTSGAVVFGRWRGHHDEKTPTSFAGRLDGCDRLQQCGEDGQCRQALPHLLASHVRLFVADGVGLLNAKFVGDARALGLRVHLVELEVAPEVAMAQQAARDAGAARVRPCDWSVKRVKWMLDPDWSTATPDTLLRTLKGLLSTATTSASSAPVSVQPPARVPCKCAQQDTTTLPCPYPLLQWNGSVALCSRGSVEGSSCVRWQGLLQEGSRSLAAVLTSNLMKDTNAARRSWRGASKECGRGTSNAAIKACQPCQRLARERWSQDAADRELNATILVLGVRSASAVHAA